MRKNAVRARLASQQGATIIFALFFFIVCAVIGSVVLTAGTAAAGRLAQMKEMDEHYYAVNSAAEVLEYELSKPDVYMLVKEETKNGETVLKLSDSGINSRAEDNQFLKLLLKGLVDNQGKLVGAGRGTLDLSNLTLAYPGTDNVKLNASVSISTEGTDEKSKCNLKIQIRNADNEGEKYIVTMICPAHFDQRVYKDFDGEIPETTEYKVTWSVSSVMKGAW